MKKKVKSVINKYIYLRDVKTSYAEDRNDSCYYLGYIDGYFDENIYRGFLVKESDFEFYSKGEIEGAKDRKQYVEKDLLSYKKEKVDWIKNLALFDLLNGEIERNFKTLEYDYRSSELFRIFKCSDNLINGSTIKLNRSNTIFVKNYINDRKTR